MATAAATLTSAQSSAVTRMADAAARRDLTVFGPSSYRVPEADPGSPVWCVSSQRRNGAWHLVWVQTVDAVPRLMCSCPARQSPRVFTCSHAQAVRLQLATHCAAHRSRSAAYVESPVSAPASPPAPSSGQGLGSAVAGAVPFCGFCGRSGVRSCGVWLCLYVRQGAIPVEREQPASGECDEVPAIPPDAVESLNAWIEALDAAGPLPVPADLGEPDQPGPGEDDDPDDDDPDPLPPAAAAAGAAVESEPEPEPASARIIHCPRCGREADVDIVVAHGSCDRCIHARPELSLLGKRTERQKAEMRRSIIAAEESRQRRYQHTGRMDDWRRSEEARERDAKRRERRERREADDAANADERETAPLYRDNRGISPWR